MQGVNDESTEIWENVVGLVEIEERSENWDGTLKRSREGERMKVLEKSFDLGRREREFESVGRDREESSSRILCRGRKWSSE